MNPTHGRNTCQEHVAPPPPVAIVPSPGRAISVIVAEHSPVIAAKGLKRLGTGVAAIVAAGIGAFALVPIFIPADHVRDAVKAEIRAATGLEPMLQGDASVSLFPSARVSLGHVILGDNPSGETALTADRLIAKLRLLPIFLGRIEIADISLVRPRIAVTFDSHGKSNWSALIDTLARTLKPNAKRADRLLSFSEIRVANGTVFVRDERNGIAETLAGVELSLAWPSISKSFGATGRFLWRNEPVDASFTLTDLFAAIAGSRSGVKVRLTGAPLKVAFEGHMSHRPALKIEGTLAADAPSLRQALRWTGLRSLPGGGLGRFALRAQTTVSGSSVALASVNLELDGNTTEGVITIGLDGRPILQGTLAAEALDLSPYVSTLRLVTQDEREWNAGRIAVDGLAGFDFDLRLSAARIALVNAKLGRTAIAASLRGGRMTLAIGESQAFGGTLKGSLGLAKSEAGVDLKAQLQFIDVDLENCLGELFAVRRLEGKGNLSFAVEASGSSVLALTRTLNGQANVAARHGALAGLNLEQLLRRLERRPLSGAGDFRSGRTPFERLTVALKIVQGTATVDDVRMEGAAVKIALAGSASIPARDLDLKGTASLTSATASDPVAFELPFVVQGRWEDPVMLPDAQSLNRRSGAAAPLLDAVRERRARDAVRSAIETLTRIPPAPAPAVSAAPGPGQPAPVSLIPGSQ
jgi:AsmA protein